MKNLIIFLTFTLLGCMSPERFPSEIDRYEAIPRVEYTISQSDHARFQPIDYPGVTLRATVLLASPEQPLAFTAHDLAVLHLMLAYAWRDHVGGDGDEVLDCFESGVIYVPATTEEFVALCGGDGFANFGCYHAAEVFELDVNYVQVIRGDWFSALGNPEINQDYTWGVAHEAAHHLTTCLFNDLDFEHSNTEVFDQIVPLAKDYFNQWLESEGRLVQ